MCLSFDSIIPFLRIDLRDNSEVYTVFPFQSHNTKYKSVILKIEHDFHIQHLYFRS